MTPEQRADHDRDYRKHEWRPGDRLPLDQREALSKLIGYCEGIVGTDLLGEEIETKLRRHIAGALAAFNMPSKAERESVDA